MPETRIVNTVHEWWPQITAVFVLIIAGIKLWFHERNKITREIKVVSDEMQMNARSNQIEHAEIMQTINDNHVATINKMLELHKK